MATPLIFAAAALWPHILTPAIFILFFTLPPFRHRTALIVLFAACMIYPCLLAPMPPSAERMSAIRAGMVSMWMFYAGWLAKMLFHSPESEFWRDGRPPREAERMGFGWEKFKWALGLLTAWRGVGWNFRPPPGKLPAARKPVGRWRFVLRETARAGVYYVATDAATIFYQRSHFWNKAESIADLSWGRKAALELAIGASVWWMSEYLFAIYAAFLVATGLSREEEFIPLFGDITAVHSLGAFWGQFWHQNCRIIFTDYARFLARHLGIPHRSLLYWPVHAWTAFLMSGVLHALPSWSLPAMLPFDGVYERFTSLFLFFVLQAVGVTLEIIFFISPGEDILLYEIGLPDVWILGRMWTAIWLVWSGQFALECWLSTQQGMLELQFGSVVGRLLRT